MKIRAREIKKRRGVLPFSDTERDGLVRKFPILLITLTMAYAAFTPVTGA